MIGRFASVGLVGVVSITGDGDDDDDVRKCHTYIVPGQPGQLCIAPAHLQNFN